MNPILDQLQGLYPNLPLTLISKLPLSDTSFIWVIDTSLQVLSVKTEGNTIVSTDIYEK